jgi:hypothetical protein
MKTNFPAEKKVLPFGRGNHPRYIHVNVTPDHAGV